MSAGHFAQLAKSAPENATTDCGGSYTCHTAVLHWAFMDAIPCNDAGANRRTNHLTKNLCTGCSTKSSGGLVTHNSIASQSYGPMFCSSATKVERDQLSLLNVGDVLISGHPSNPMHSMVVVENDLMLGGQNCFIRGFNNRGTFGDQSPFLAYDAVDRNINDNAYWSKEGFGTAPSWNPLYVVSYLNFSLAVSTAAKYMFMR